MGFLDELRPDPRCTACNRVVAACICTRHPSKALTRKPPRERRPRVVHGR